MKEWKRLSLVTALVVFAAYLVVGSAMAGSVKIQTSGGNGACATYYTQAGDSATGRATVSPSGSVNLTTQGSVQMGLVQADSGGGNRAFTPFTGDFSASASAGAGAGASSTATSANPRVDIFVATKPANSTVGNYTIDGVPGTTYGDIGTAVGAANAGGDGANPDWILVDQGTFNERVTINGFEQNSALTSVWCADDTTINGAGGGRAVDINNSPGFLVEGLSVTGASGPSGSDAIGIDVRGGSTGAEIRCNTVTDNNNGGIRVDGSTNVGIRNNTVTGSGNAGGNATGIRVMSNSHNAEITDNTVTGSTHHGISVLDSNGATITGNTTSDNGRTGVWLRRSDNTVIMNNIVSNNNVSGGADWHGIAVEDGSDDAQITDNTVTGNANNGIWVKDSGDGDMSGDGVVIQGNTVTRSTLNGIRLDDSPDARITNNIVTDNGTSGSGTGISVRHSDNVNITGNLTRNAHNGIGVLGDSDNAVISDNIIIGNQQAGINLRNTANNTIVTGNTISGNGQAGADWGGIRLRNSASVQRIDNNNIASNFNYGLRNQTGNAIDAEDNWWGAASGPGGIGPGTGDAILNTGGGSVDFTPFRTTPAP